MDDEFLIECMENETENSFFDFKKDIYDFSIPKCKDDFLTDVLSFANSHLTGDKYIITGIKLHEDNSRDFCGITESKIKDGSDYQSLINDNIEPTIIVDFKIIEYNKKKYGVFRINKENQDKPYLLSKAYNNLQKGFIRIRKGQKNEYVNRRDFDLFYKDKNNAEFSDIYIKGIINDRINENFQVEKFSYEFDTEAAKNEIHNLFDEVIKIELIKSASLKFGNKLCINKSDIERIESYAKNNDISLPNNFFDIGNMTYYSLGHTGTNYYGSESEKQKYQLISELANMIALFEGLKDFYEKIDNIFYVELLIQNLGKKFDEDIEVTLKIEKGKLLTYEKFPIPSEAIIEHILDNSFLDECLENKKINGVNNYTSKNQQIFPIPSTSIKLPIGYSKQSYEASVDYYKEYIKTVADCDLTSDDKYDYITFNQKEIKPNELIHTPSRLLFLSKPSIIEYEIKTKYNPNIKTGKILIKEDS